MGSTSDPARKCLATGIVKPKVELIRFVLGPDRTIVPDLAGRLPGRGLWVSATRADVQTCVDKDLFSKSARQKVTLADDLTARVEDLLVERTIAALSLARRSGSVVPGFTKVEAALRKTASPLALLEASDGAADGRRKLTNLAKVSENGTNSQISVIGCLTSRELGLAFGRGSVIHAALTNSGAGNKAFAELQRLGGFRPWRPLKWDQNKSEAGTG